MVAQSAVVWQATLFAVKGVLILDNDGKRIVAKVRLGLYRIEYAGSMREESMRRVASWRVGGKIASWRVS